MLFRSYLVISEACGLSSLAALLEKRRAASGSTSESVSLADLPIPSSAAPRIAAAPSVARQAPAPAPAGGSRGTIMLDQFVAEQQVAVAQAAQATTAADDDDDQKPVTIARGSDQPAILAPQEVARQMARLAYVCQLIRQADRKSTRLNSSHVSESRMPSSA